MQEEPVAINRTKVELKRNRELAWESDKHYQSYQSGIETGKFGKDVGETFSINRTKVELKLQEKEKLTQKVAAINRTKVELKLSCAISTGSGVSYQSYQSGIETYKNKDTKIS